MVRQPEDRDLHGETTFRIHDLHERQLQNSCQDHCSCTEFVKKTVHTISRSKSVGSISNKMDPEGKTKIISDAKKQITTTLMALTT